MGIKLVKRNASLLVAAGLLLLFLSACGSGASPASSGQQTTDEAATASEEVVIKASNFAFDQQEYRVKQGVPVKISFENTEGTHGVIIQNLNVRLDSRNTSQVITPEQKGEYAIDCSVFCGTGHHTMTAKLIVE
ncbi:cupredoxin domain-containing protein [Paenibacillus sp. P96]|uniref:Cupredoxin domain-containing protein n=1 Tax=Paenibacillus zeirhizosphaerae TaxID=2987519 RepID=A0ABT9FL74_9BACL|nr:cupredoxin domain-containing protein [Paenibacillus sp. P96]MDP4095493.1 cupredoxin domain-containing protein [Paenibacillus sp. P96]